MGSACCPVAYAQPLMMLSPIDAAPVMVSVFTMDVPREMRDELISASSPSTEAAHALRPLAMAAPFLRALKPVAMSELGPPAAWVMGLFWSRLDPRTVLPSCAAAASCRLGLGLKGWVWVEHNVSA